VPARKVIISCAITGSIHTPSMSPHLPVTAAEIAESALGAAGAGAAIVHLHARNPIDGRPDQSPEAFEPFLRVIKQRSDVVVNLTTGGSPYMTVEERIKPAAVWKPEVASLNMGSMNFGLFPMLKRYKQFKYDWEPAMLEGSHDLVFRNSFKDIRYALETLNSTGARYEFECYDTSHLYNLHYFWTEGLVKAPLFIQTVFGLLGGIGAHQDRAVEVLDFELLARRDGEYGKSQHRKYHISRSENRKVKAPIAAAFEDRIARQFGAVDEKQRTDGGVLQQRKPVHRRAATRNNARQQHGGHKRCDIGIAKQDKNLAQTISLKGFAAGARLGMARAGRIPYIAQGGPKTRCDLFACAHKLEIFCTEVLLLPPAIAEGRVHPYLSKSVSREKVQAWQTSVC